MTRLPEITGESKPVFAGHAFSKPLSVIHFGSNTRFVDREKLTWYIAAI